MSRKKSLKNLSRFSHYTGYSMWSLCQSYISQVLQTLKRSSSEQPFGQIENRLVYGWLTCTSRNPQISVKDYSNLVYNFFSRQLLMHFHPKNLKVDENYPWFNPWLNLWFSFYSAPNPILASFLWYCITYKLAYKLSQLLVWPCW